MIVDQFEELFTLNPPEVQLRFAELLGGMSVESDVRVLLSMRDDFFLQCHEYRSLAPIFSEPTPLHAPKGTALRRALVQPALKCGYRFEEESLVEEMIAEVSEERGALPLLAFAAAQLWERRERQEGLLTRASYEAIGGVGGALAQHAEATLEKIGSDRLPMVREIFRNLVTAQGTRAARDMEELLSIFEDRGAAEEVIRELIDARLLTSFEVSAGEEEERGRHRVEIIHESLLKAWPRLVRWQTQDQEGAQLRDELRQAAQLWEQHGRSADRLWTGTPVKEFQLWRERYSGGLTSTEQDFAQAMVQQAERRRKRMRFAIAATIGVLIGIVALVGAFWQRSEAAREEAVNEALRAEAGKVLALGQLEIERYPTAAVAYALKSLELSDTLETRLFALKALQKGPTALILAPEGLRDTGWAHVLRFSPDGKWLAIGGYDRLRIQPRDGEAPFLVSEYPSGGQVVIPAFSHDGNRLGAVKRGDVRIWSVPDFKKVGGAKIEEGPTGLFATQNAFYTVTSFNREGWVRRWPFGELDSRLVGRMEARTAGADIDLAGNWFAYAIGGRIFVRSLNDWERPRRLLGEHPADVEADSTGEVPAPVRFRPDGRQLATSDASGEIRLWSLDSESKEPVGILDGSGLTRGLCFDGSGNQLAAFGRPAGTPTVRLWNRSRPSDAEPTVLRSRNSNFMNGAALDSSGRWLATANVGNVAFWPLGTRLPITLTGHEGPVNDVAFTPDGKHLVSASVETVRVWALESGAPSRVILEKGLVFPQLAMDPRGEFIVVSGYCSVFVVPLEGGTPRALEDCSTEAFYWGVALSSEGRLVAAAPNRGPAKDKVIRIWDLESGKSWTLDPPESADDGTEFRFVGLRFLPDGRLLSCGRNGLHLWNVETGYLKALSTIPAYRCRYDGRFVLRQETSDTGNWLVRFDIEKGVSQVLSSHGNDIGFPGFDPLGKLVLSTGKDGEVRIGPLTGGEPHVVFAHDEGLVNAAVVSPDRRWIASAGFDGKVRLWPMPDIDKQPFHTLPLEDLLERLRNVTNVRVVEDDASSNGYRIDIARFPGWEKLPEW